MSEIESGNNWQDIAAQDFWEECFKLILKNELVHESAVLADTCLEEWKARFAGEKSEKDHS
jgi:hypothetical protein